MKKDFLPQEKTKQEEIKMDKNQLVT